jgi:hypothetical protein
MIIRFVYFFTAFIAVNDNKLSYRSHSKNKIDYSVFLLIRKKLILSGFYMIKLPRNWSKVMFFERYRRSFFSICDIAGSDPGVDKNIGAFMNGKAPSSAKGLHSF